jgi:hypothetical protein
MVLSGWSSIGAASQRSRIKWTSITDNREIKERVHPVGASTEINLPGTDAFMVWGWVLPRVLLSGLTLPALYYQGGFRLAGLLAANPRKSRRPIKILRSLEDNLRSDGQNCPAETIRV